MTKATFAKNLALAAIVSVSTAQAAIVSWSVDQFGTVSTVSGVAPAANWTNTVPSGGNPYVGKTLSDLVDDTGTATTIDISYGAWGAWRIQASHPGTDGDGTNNKELLNGYLNAGPAPWNPSVTASSVAISQIPYASYNIIVYFSSDQAGREGQVSAGASSFYFSSLGAASVAGSNALLTQTTSTSTADYAGATYAVFTGLSGDSQTISVQMRDNDEWGGIAGFQIVAIPEPSAALLGAFGMLAFARRRRA
ncbi:MAG: PEP-CTERM sorting domain-containing protein [Verrucomicrobiaceae bacterium]|nr:MAG: PEP-CTERM sorting domain-containing protein [Verrucomicrobiaceae bacterium]